MPQMFPLPWISIFFASMILLWTLMAVVFFLYQTHPVSSTSEFLNQTVYPSWKW